MPEPVEVSVDVETPETEEPSDHTNPDSSYDENVAEVAAQETAGQSVVTAGIDAGIAAGEAREASFHATQAASEADQHAQRVQEAWSGVESEISRLQEIAHSLAESAQAVAAATIIQSESEASPLEEPENPSTPDLDLEPAQEHWLTKRWFTRKGSHGA